MDKNNNFFFLLLILIIPVGIFFFIRQRKKKNSEGERVITGKQKKQESEAWVTIKKYLKENGETGKEIIELFVLKRMDEKDVSQYPKEMKQKIKEENKKKKEELKKQKKENPSEYKKKKSLEKRNRAPEYWCLYFITRNAKTKEVDKPRIIEAIITYEKISKKQTDRVINVNDKIDFKKEWEWIKPIKDKEDAIKLKNEKQNKKREERKSKLNIKDKIMKKIKKDKKEK